MLTVELICAPTPGASVNKLGSPESSLLPPSWQRAAGGVANPFRVCFFHRGFSAPASTGCEHSLCGSFILCPFLLELLYTTLGRSGFLLWKLNESYAPTSSGYEKLQQSFLSVYRLASLTKKTTKKPSNHNFLNTTTDLSSLILFWTSGSVTLKIKAWKCIFNGVRKTHFVLLLFFLNVSHFDTLISLRQWIK